MSRHRKQSVAIVSAALVGIGLSSGVWGADLYWQAPVEGTGNLTDSNYYNATTGTPGSGITSTSDVLYILGGGTAIATTAGSISVGRLWIGDASTGGGTNAPAGDGTVNIGPGVSVSTTTGGGGPTNAGVRLAAGANGTLNINGGSLTVNSLLTIGYGSDSGITGSVNVTNGGSITVNASNLNLGDNVNNPGHGGEAGSLTLSDGTITVKTTSGNAFNIGIQNRSSFTQTGGTMTVGANTVVGTRDADGSSFTLSGGSFTTASMVSANGAASDGYTDNITTTVSGGTLSVTGGLTVANGAGRNTQFLVTGGTVTSAGFNVATGNNNADNTTVAISGGSLTCSSFNVGSATSSTNDPTNTHITFSGSATVTTSGGFNITQKAADQTSLTIKDNAVVSMGNALSIGAGAATNTSLTIGGNAQVTVGTAAANNVLIGRATTSNTTFTMTGGTLGVSKHFLMGTDSGASASGIVANHSGGTITTAANFVVDDTSTGDATYNLSGTGAVVVNGRGIVGRQKGTGVMNQTGGSATFNDSLHVGDSQGTDPTAYGSGTYTLSGGSVTAALAAGSTAVDAFAIGQAGNGTFRVVGGDATMSVTGNMGVYANTNGGTNVGKLAYRLEAGEALTTINVSGVATFGAGSGLQLDFNGVKPTFGVYTVLRATDVVNGGLVASVPAGWAFQITDGGGGKVLRFFAGDANGDGVLNADDYALVDRGAAKHLSGGQNGDFNGDGVVDSQDYLLMDTAYLSQHSGAAPDPGFLAAREAEFGAGYVAELVAAVPEPGTVGLACGAVLALVGGGRRRRQPR